MLILLSSHHHRFIWAYTSLSIVEPLQTLIHGAAFENEMESESDSESSLQHQQESLLEADQDEKTSPSQLYRYMRVDKYFMIWRIQMWPLRSHVWGDGRCWGSHQPVYRQSGLIFFLGNRCWQLDILFRRKRSLQRVSSVSCVGPMVKWWLSPLHNDPAVN